MNNPRISVIVPIYNVEKYIGRCVESLMAQTFNEAEYIFVDDGSKDHSVTIAKNTIAKFPEKSANCKFIHHENSGLTAARNSGIRVAKGDYIIHSDSDDWLEPTMLETLYKEAIQYGADVAYSDFWMETQNNSEYYQTYPWNASSQKNIEKYICSPWTVLWNMLVKRDLYFDNNIRSVESLSFCEDFNLSVKLLIVSKKTIHVNKALYHYNRTNVQSMTHQYDEKRTLSEQEAYEDVAHFMEGRGIYSEYNKEMGWRFLRSKDPYLVRKDKLQDYLKFRPESHSYILSCPYMSLLRKIMAWFLTHNMKCITLLFIDIRQLFGKK